MKLLLDTHAFLWWDAKDARLAESFRSAIASPRNEVFVSAATVWEIAIKRASGKLIFMQPVGKSIEEYGFSSIPITGRRASATASRPI
jgi:PIN domain nuclease of toxin-antitoxin system